MNFDNYEIIEHRWISNLNSDGYILMHRKTKAYVTLLLNDDDNKVFYIGFKTPPKDSTGVAHILEHSVLCGSKKYPVKDPFVELAKGSLNTFLNAMTYPDKTVYPVASCNDKDFMNLVDVYLDAVFNPNIYRESKIFKQEGWHYEMESIDDELSINGVVYNEMKGVFSSPDDVVEREIMNSLYPDSTYGIESGGDPEYIPTLTYEQFIDFHSRYYHPSNSFIYLYGNMDAEKYIEYIDREYLSKYDYKEPDSEIVCCAPFDKPVKLEKDYSVLDEDSDDGYYLTYNISTGKNNDKELYIAMDVLDYVLCGAPGAIIKKALYDNGIGDDVYSSVETGIYQPYFSITAKGVREDRLDDFSRIIEDELKKASNQLPKKALKAALNVFEFRYREADFGSYPRGLMLGLQALDSWLYDKNAPFMHIEQNETYAKLKKGIDEGYFEGVIEKYFINNPHKSIISFAPKVGLTKEKEDQLKEKLSEFKKNLSKEQLQDIVDETAALKEYQSSPDRPEDLEKIPMLTRDDLKKKPFLPVNNIRESECIPILHHDIFTSGISYANLLFDVSKVPAGMYPYVGLLLSLLGVCDTKSYKYNDLFNEINIHTGGIRPAYSSYYEYHTDNDIKRFFIVRAKYLKEESEAVFELLEEILLYTDFSDTKRLQEKIGENKMRLQSVMMSSGHVVASVRAQSYFSKEAWIYDRISGCEYYRFICELADDFENRKKEIVENLAKVYRMIINRDNIMADFTGTEDDYNEFAKRLPKLVSDMSRAPETISEDDRFAPDKKNEGLKTSGQVQYVAMAGNYRKKGLEYTGALAVLRVLLGYDYLWSNVRVLGGAYGCMSTFKMSGDSFFVSYRDPNLASTVEIFKKAADYIKNVKLDERKVLQYVIGALADLDAPMTPYTKGDSSLSAYLSRITDEDILKIRSQLLETDEETIHGLYKYIEAFINDDNICVVGNAEVIESNREMFMNTQQLL